MTSITESPVRAAAPRSAAAAAALGRAGVAGIARAVPLAAILCIAPAALADEAALERHCGACHAADGDALTRIDGQRKTPEGWQMTIVRMRQVHGLDIDGDVQRELVRHLSATRGLAPAESEGLRYALDREPAAQEDFEPEMMEMCGRCHTMARVALQRRTLEEWLLHVDFHVGQYPTIEYQALGRDREWYRIAREEIAPALAERYPLETEAWTAWQAATMPDARGAWIVATRLPEGGPAFGRLEVSGDAQPFSVTGELATADGDPLPVSGRLNVYGGHEWRATLDVGGTVYRQILSLGEDGERLEGRQFPREDDSLGAALSGLRADGDAAIVAVHPGHVAAGAETTVHVIGRALGDALSVPAGLEVLADEAAPWGRRLALRASADASGPLELGIDGATASVLVHDAIDRLTIEPAYAVARVGDADGPVPPAKARFDAIGWLDGTDGESGTDDDVRVGPIDAEWSVAPFDETAELFDDVAFAGSIDDESGVFTPAGAGPNAERPFSTNNAGNLRVVASHGALEAEAQLIVTVQRWVDPPVR